MSVILIADSDDLELEFVESIVRDEVQNRHSIVTANTGTVALQLAKRYSPDIVIIDVYLNEMDGMDVAEEIRQVFPKCCICILTACTDFQYAMRAVRLHAFDYILKPAKPEELKTRFLGMMESVSSTARYGESGLSMAEELKYMADDAEGYKSFVDDSLKYIQEHFKERLKLPHVASRVYMNPQYFSRVFKRETGVSFTEYVNMLKIKYACKLLETTNYPAYRIASECGFTDPSYFNRVFCSHMKMTPQKYKRSFRMSEDLAMDDAEGDDGYAE